MILKSPLNYAGSKDKIMEQLLYHFPKKNEVSKFYDVFAGGLSVTINCEYKKIVSNDIILPLIEFYKNLYNCNNIESEIENILSYKIDKNSQESYIIARKEFNNNKDPYLFFALVSSCTNNMMRFNKKFEFNQTFGKRTINDKTIDKIRLYHNNMKSKEIEFKNNHFINLFKNNNITENDFVYMDPPYAFITEAGYNAYWSKDDENSLYDIINMLNNKNIRFALSGVSIHKGKENPNIRKLDKYNIIHINHDYEKVARIKNLGDTQEILVTNYDL